MKTMKDGGSINIPYMIIEKLCQLSFSNPQTVRLGDVIKGWKNLVIIAQDGTKSLKLKVYWSKDEDDEDLGNGKALNDIFNGVYKNMFILINICVEGKED